jgi:anti-sigma-K factor RskA
MSETGRPTSPHDCGGDAAAYVLDALEPQEAEAFRRHLDSCIVCRDEVAAFERLVDVLPGAAPQFRAPNSLRRRVRREVRRSTPSPYRAQAATSAGRWRGLSVPRLRVAGAAGALAVAIAALVILLGSSGGAPTRTIAAAVTGQGTAQLRVGGDHAELVVHNFPAPPSGEVYEVWLQRGSGRVSPTPTLFSVTSQGDADVGVSGKLSGVRAVMVTPERAGGSLVPTHAPVLVARLT